MKLLPRLIFAPILSGIAMLQFGIMSAMVLLLMSIPVLIIGGIISGCLGYSQNTLATSIITIMGCIVLGLMPIVGLNTFYCVLFQKDNWLNAMALTQDRQNGKRL
jgi:hypothetical protein